MTLKKETIAELGQIMKRKYNVTFSPSDLEKYAYSLVGYFSLLQKVEIRNKNKGEFGNSSASRIDNEVQKKEDGEETI